MWLLTVTEDMIGPHGSSNEMSYWSGYAQIELKKKKKKEGEDATSSSRHL